MKVNIQTVKVVALTAVITCLLTNTVHDFNYVKNNGKIMRKLSAVTEKIKDYSIYRPEDELMADTAATALAASVGDKYTRYLDEYSYKQYMDATSSSYFGVGITLQTDYTSEAVMISEIAEDGPSARAGVAVGDILTAVDGDNCTSTTLRDIITNIKSKPEGDTVILTLLRNGEQIEITVPVEKVQSKLVSGQMLSDGVGYIKIASFDGSLDKDARTAYDDFVDMVSELRDSGMTKMVIDLRNNPGGDFGVVASIADEILSEGLITYTEDKDGEQSMLHAQEGGLDYPIAVVTNGASASASEVLTAALKDNGKAIVVGEKTYGKGVVQSCLSLADGSGLIVTSARYFTPGGICIDGIGIEPDILCTLPEGTTVAHFAPENDPQIMKAVEALSQE
ncbi:MAG: PDZ domain-containing protein [Clostridia bacterium]|nr:PDZ domain-containing protein [Clostridia bacterium]